MTCQAAAAAIAKTYGTSETHVSRPGGCFLDTGTSKVDFNTNATGAAFVNAQPLCRFGASLRARLCVYPFRVLAVCSHGDAFSTNAVTARPSRRRLFVTCVQPRTRRTLPTPTPARRGTPRSPTPRRVKPRRRSSGRRTVPETLYQLNRAGATSTPRHRLSTSTTTRPAPLPLTHSRSASFSVRRSNPPSAAHLRVTPWVEYPMQ
jgi:hypothetical protein